MRARKRLWILALLVLIGLGTWLVWSRKHTLLDRATPIANVSGWALFDPLITYHWLSSQNVLFLRYSPNGYNACLLNVPTGTVTALTTLSQLLQKSKWTSYSVDTFTPSPDGKWLLWIVMDKQGNSRYYFSGVDGSSYVCWAKSAANSFQMSWKPYWMPDSQQWLFLQNWENQTSTSYAWIYSIHSPRTYRAVPISLPIWSLNNCSGNLANSDIVALQDRILEHLLCEDNGEIIHGVEFAQANLGTRQKPMAPIPLAVPSGGKIEQVLLDPHGFHTLWIIRSDQVPPFAAFLHRLIPAYKTQRSWCIFSISEADGTNMHEIGRVEIKPERYLGYRDAPANISWLPDSKRVSFIYENKLYTVPIE